MGGAPPLPHNFAPQGVKNWPFLALFAPEDQGPGGPRFGALRPWGRGVPRRGTVWGTHQEPGSEEGGAGGGGTHRDELW